MMTMRMKPAWPSSCSSVNASSSVRGGLGRVGEAAPAGADGVGAVGSGGEGGVGGVGGGGARTRGTTTFVCVPTVGEAEATDTPRADEMAAGGEVTSAVAAD